MKKKILIDANFLAETRVVLVDKDNSVESLEYKADSKFQTKGNIYLAKVTRVEPSLQAAFVDYGDDKSGFLPLSEIHPDYFNLPAHDKLSHFCEENPALVSSEVTQEDLNEKPVSLTSDEIMSGSDVDVSKLQSLVDDRIQSDFETNAYDDDIEQEKEEDSELPREQIEARKKHQNSYRIQEVIKKGQVLLVQVTKEERGNKGASLTTYISLAGKYCVLMPNTAAHNGVSRKISNGEERRRLKDIISNLSKLNNFKASIIVRTAGAGHTTAEIKRDFEYLTKLWNQIRELTLKSNAPSFIHSEDSILLKTVRDLFDKNVKELLIQGTEAFKQCLEFVKNMMPQQVSLVREYRGRTPLFTKYAIESQLIKLYQTNVQLPSGGYVVINPTEALISIDVNSGRSTSEKNIEETALKTNLEAAREISKQLRLRDLSGLIVIDFIDMSEVKNRKIVERALKEFLSKDKARIQTSQISNFGLLEMSRQRLRPSFLEANSKMCTHCGGKGVVRVDESNSMLILRTIENEIYNSKCDIVNVYGMSNSILYLLNNKRNEISFIENKYDIKINLNIDRDATSDSYSIETVKLSNKKPGEEARREPLLQNNEISYSESMSSNKSRRKISGSDAGRVGGSFEKSSKGGKVLDESNKSDLSEDIVLEDEVTTNTEASINTNDAISANSPRDENRKSRNRSKRSKSKKISSGYYDASNKELANDKVQENNPQGDYKEIVSNKEDELNKEVRNNKELKEDKEQESNQEANSYKEPRKNRRNRNNKKNKISSDFSSNSDDSNINSDQALSKDNSEKLNQLSEGKNDILNQNDTKADQISIGSIDSEPAEQKGERGVGSVNSSNESSSQNQKDNDKKSNRNRKRINSKSFKKSSKEEQSMSKSEELSNGVLGEAKEAEVVSEATRLAPEKSDV